MKSTSGVTLSLTKHAKKQAKEKGFSVTRILAMWDGPNRVVPSRTYKGQFRVCGDGICLVGVPKGKEPNRSFVVITCYLDQELTPPRPDQLNTKQGKRYAERYEKGLGRG